MRSVRWPLLAVCCVMFDGRCLPFVVRCLLCVACCLVCDAAVSWLMLLVRCVTFVGW